MCSAALLCDTSWAANQEIQGSRDLSLDLNEHEKNAIHENSEMNESRPESINPKNSNEITRMSLHDDMNDENETESTTNLQQVARHDSGVPEDLSSPCPEDSPIDKGEHQDEDEDPDGTINSDCNITVLHVTTEKKSEIIESSPYDCTVSHESQEIEASSVRDFTPDSKDSKDGSDSGVEGCANELPRVEYASSCNGLDEVSCDSSLVSCCSVYEDPCAIIAEDSRLRSININGTGGSGGGGGGGAGGGSGGAGGEGTSEGGSESSSLAGSVGGSRGGRTTSTKRSSFALSSNSSAQNTVLGTSSKRKTDSTSSKSSSSAQSNASDDRNSRSSTTSRVKIRSTTTPSRSSSNSRNTTNAPWRERGRSRESSRSVTRTEITTASNSINSNDQRRGSNARKLPNSTSIPGNQSNPTNRTRTRQLPDSLPSSLTTEIDRDLAAQRGKSSTSGLSRSRGAGNSCNSRVTNPRVNTPGSTPSEDSRKSLLSTTTRNLYNPKNDRTLSLDEKALDTYATLPRARNRGNFSLVKSIDRVEDLNGKIETNRTTTNSRDGSLNRLNNGKKCRGSNIRDCNVSVRKCLPPYPRSKIVGMEKTRIYHETSSQTGLTFQDIENALGGISIRQIDPSSIERQDNYSQTEDKWEDFRIVKEQLEIITAEATRLKRENEILEAERTRLDNALTEERADHAFARQELDKNARRVVAMLGTPQSEHDESSDSFLELETHFQSSGQVVANQQIEIADLQSLCRMLNRDLEKSLAAQKSLLQQQQELEAESAEMQDFLQDEKATLVEALKDVETEVIRKNELLTMRDAELARLTEECKHLVRMSEQRRQENLSLGMKLNAVERRGRELLLGQGAAVSGAAVALSGLGTRLEGLVDQLVRSYKISEKDLEDVVYHNEAYSRSNSSAESSPVSSKHSMKECTPSPKRGSFVSAVIGAIRNAATHPFATKTTSDKRPSPVETTKHIFKELSTESSSDLLDFETEPCLMMESVLEDVPLPDTYSHNMVSSSDSLRRALSVPEPIDEINLRIPRLNDESTSLTNLTQAILNRRKAEDEEEVGECDSQSGSDGGITENNSTAPMNDYCPAVNLVDQVIDVDNLVTKLLKVLRIIQLDNDTCIRDLRDDKSELECKLEAHNSELEELRKIAANIQDSDDIFADAVDDRRLTIVENRRDSSIDDDPAEEQNANCVDD